MLPEDAVESLRSLVSRSQRFLFEAILEGASEGSIRRDIEPETLLVTISGNPRSRGDARAHRRSRTAGKADPERVLDGLRRMLAPSVVRGPKRNPKEKKK